MGDAALTDAHAWGDLTDQDAQKLLDEALDTVASRAQFADARLVEAEELRSYQGTGHDPDDRLERTLGIGVRVLAGGAWGFASRPLSDPGDAAAVARSAYRVAHASIGSSAPVDLPARDGVCGTYATTLDEDPFKISVTDRHALLDSTFRQASVSPQVRDVQVGVNAKRQHRHLANTEGAMQHQHFVECGGSLIVVAGDDHDVQRRTYPNSFHGNTAAAGWEHVRRLRLPETAARVGEEACALLTAPTAPPGRSDLVIGAQQVALQIHESCGHALELDRILGDERDFAGTSFVNVADIGRGRYGSDVVNITSDPTVEGTRGSFRFDDEGTPARRAPLVRAGIIVNTLSSRDSAARAGLELTGAARSDGWAYMPVCFSTHVYLEPGQGDLDALLDRLGDGYYIDDNRSWSIANDRLNFQFGTEVAYEVRHGRKGRLMKNFSYGGVTPRFWRSVEAVAGRDEFKVFGYPCGKGEPKQWGFLSHGASPVLVRDIRTGVA